MKKLTTLLVLLSVLTFTTFAQETNRRSQMKTGIGLQLIGPTNVAAIEVDYFITHNFNVEAGAGFYGVYASAKYYFGKADEAKPLAPYLGFTYKLPELLTGDSHGVFYFPLGIQLITKGGFTFAPEFAIKRVYSEGTGLWAALRFGYHF